MKKFIDYLTDTALREAIARVHTKIESDPKVKALADDLMDILYSEQNQRAFLDTFNDHRAFLSTAIGSDLVDCFLAAAFDMHFDKLQKKYSSRNIPEEVLAATIDDFNIWAECHFLQYGRPGISEFGWLVCHMSGELFKVGRLQYIVSAKFGGNFHVYKGRAKGEIIVIARDGLNIDADGFITEDTGSFTTRKLDTDMYIEANPVDATGCILSQPIRLVKAEYELVLTEGDPVLDMHIPASGRLSYEECRRSMEESIAFAKQHFPEYRHKAFTLDCWLLSEEIKEILDENTNVRKFAGMFNRVGGYKSSDGCNYKRIFGFDKNQADWQNHKAVTTLQKGTHTLMQENRWFIERHGILIIGDNSL